MPNGSRSTAAGLGLIHGLAGDLRFRRCCLRGRGVRSVCICHWARDGWSGRGTRPGAGRLSLVSRSRSRGRYYRGCARAGGPGCLRLPVRARTLFHRKSLTRVPPRPKALPMPRRPRCNHPTVDIKFFCFIFWIAVVMHSSAPSSCS